MSLVSTDQNFSNSDWVGRRYEKLLEGFDLKFGEFVRCDNCTKFVDSDKRMTKYYESIQHYFEARGKFLNELSVCKVGPCEDAHFIVNGSMMLVPLGYELNVFRVCGGKVANCVLPYGYIFEPKRDYERFYFGVSSDEVKYFIIGLFKNDLMRELSISSLKLFTLSHEVDNNNGILNYKPNGYRHTSIGSFDIEVKGIVELNFFDFGLWAFVKSNLPNIESVRTYVMGGNICYDTLERVVRCKKLHKSIKVTGDFNVDENVAFFFDDHRTRDYPIRIEDFNESRVKFSQLTNTNLIEFLKIFNWEKRGDGKEFVIFSIRGCILPQLAKELEQFCDNFTIENVYWSWYTYEPKLWVLGTRRGSLDGEGVSSIVRQYEARLTCKDHYYGDVKRHVLALKNAFGLRYFTNGDIFKKVSLDSSF
jgi:hypothetical protein